MLKIEISNVNSHIYGDHIDIIFHLLKQELSYLVQNYQFVDAYHEINPRTGERKWDGRVMLCWQLKNSIKFVTGLYYKVKAILKNNDIPFKVVDKREKFKRSFDIQFADGVKLRPYQEDAVNTSVKTERGIIKAATGAGKTIMAAGVYQQLGVKNMVFFAMNGDLILQAKREFEKFLTINGEPIKVGLVAAGICDIENITVVSVQSACTAFDLKYVLSDEDDVREKSVEKIVTNKKMIRQLISNCECVIFDEVQHAACQTVRSIMERCDKAQYRYGASGSPWRDDKADLFIDAFFGKRIVDISASYLIKKGYLVKPTIYFIRMDVEWNKYANYTRLYKDNIVECEIRNGIIKKKAKEHVNKGEVVLILVKKINHGKKLESEIDGSYFLSGKTAAKKRQKFLDEFREGKLNIIIATSIFDEAIDVQRLNCLINAGSGKSSTRALQRIGRALRTFEGKDHATIYDFMDNAKYLSDHAKARRRIYKTEKEFKIVEIDAADCCGDDMFNEL